MKFLFVGIVLFCLASPVFSEEGGRVFTNDDLGAYKKEYGATVYPAPKTGARQERLGKEKRGREDVLQKKKDYYCRYGTRYKRAMDDAERTLKGCRENFYQKRKAAHFLISEESGCAHEKRAYQRAREKYQDLADEAGRDNIPDGWVRCQFE